MEAGAFGQLDGGPVISAALICVTDIALALYLFCSAWRSW